MIHQWIDFMLWHHVAFNKYAWRTCRLLSLILRWPLLRPISRMKHFCTAHFIWTKRLCPLHRASAQKQNQFAHTARAQLSLMWKIEVYCSCCDTKVTDHLPLKAASLWCIHMVGCPEVTNTFDDSLSFRSASNSVWHNSWKLDGLKCTLFGAGHWCGVNSMLIRLKHNAHCLLWNEASPNPLRRLLIERQ